MQRLRDRLAAAWIEHRPNAFIRRIERRIAQRWEGLERNADPDYCKESTSGRSALY